MVSFFILNFSVIAKSDRGRNVRGNAEPSGKMGTVPSVNVEFTSGLSPFF